MLTCPMCKKPLKGLEKTCSTCRTDLSLLVDYVGSLEDGLRRAERLTRAGELGEAVWSYLEVLEVDPDNATAKRQVGKVALAVRQFDRLTEGRRWRDRVSRQARRRRWAQSWKSGERLPELVKWAACFVIAGAVLAVGFALGYWSGQHETSSASQEQQAARP